MQKIIWLIIEMNLSELSTYVYTHCIYTSSAVCILQSSTRFNLHLKELKKLRVFGIHPKHGDTS